ncbi:MAG: CinA family protein, partial [Spirochaetales bacterium]|nr:CinA family protein [Spirochaetales bacterium]
ISKLITDISGSSELFWGSLVTYSNIAKHKLLDIKKETLKGFGAVSKEVVEEMCGNILKLAGVDIAIAVSGYAGGSEDDGEDTGTVWIAVKVINRHLFASKFKFTGSRDLIRRKTAVAAMLLAETALVSPERLDSCDHWQYS